MQPCQTSPLMTPPAPLQNRRSLATEERGGPILEFALILPVIVTFLFGAVQYGLIFGAYVTVRNATAVAARYAIISDPIPTDAAVANVATGALYGLDAAKVQSVTVAAQTVAGVSGGRSVQMIYDYPTMFPVPGSKNGLFRLNVTTVMR